MACVKLGLSERRLPTKLAAILYKTGLGLLKSADLV
jgi:hypothetical protein